MGDGGEEMVMAGCLEEKKREETEEGLAALSVLSLPRTWAVL